MTRWKTSRVATVAALFAVATLSWVVVPAAAADEKKNPPGAADRKDPEGAERLEHGHPGSNPPGGAENGIARVLGLLNSILVNQQLLLKEVTGLELACTTPDLLPLPTAGSTDPTGFCRRDSQGNLHVLVQNQGGGAAGAFTTSILFNVPGAPGGNLCGDCFEVDVLTPGGLAGFAGTDLTVPMPSGCVSTDSRFSCEFKIAVDSTSAVAESNEANNNAFGECQRVIE